MAKKAVKMKKALMRSNTRLLLSGVMIFQCAACVLLALKGGSINIQALVFAVALPLGTYLVTTIIGKLWPVDRAIVIFALLLTSVGIITLQGIARSDVTPRTQAIYSIAGLIAMFVGAFLVRYIGKWKKLIPLLMIGCLGALALPILIGQWKYGAKNWISIAGVSIQPSEFMKPVFIIALAAGFSNRPRFLKCLPVLAFAAACCGLLLAQRDLGALLLYFLTTVVVYYAATSNVLITLAGLGMGAGAAVIAYNAFPYVQKRVAMWKNPWSDPTDSGHQLVQALIAIGSGGLFGMGLGMGSPRNIPLYHSDFIFAAMTEEFGLIFSVCVLIIYVLLIMRGLIAAMNARTSLLSLAAFGIVAIIGFQTMLIVGGNTQLLPLTGVTLPLISAGGSSLVSTFFSIGVILGISGMNSRDEANDIEAIEAEEGM